MNLDWQKVIIFILKSTAPIKLPNKAQTHQFPLNIQYQKSRRKIQEDFSPIQASSSTTKHKYMVRRSNRKRQRLE